MTKPKPKLAWQSTGVTLEQLDSLELDVESPGSLLALDQVAACKWRAVTRLRPWQAVLLHSGIDPDTAECVDQFPRIFSRGAMSLRVLISGDTRNTTHSVSQLQDNYHQVQKALAKRQLTVVSDRSQGESPPLVLRRDFLVWATKVNLPVIGPWPHRGQHEVTWSIRFPHRTSHLLLLARAAQEMWKEGQERAPVAKEVVAYLMHEQGLTSRTLARAMATILRPDGLPKGRRRNA